ncbi:cytidine deaminase family protein [Treponema sp. R80B11-R83G3]
MEAGEVSSAILTENGNVFTGVCIDTSCSLGMCAERNAIANMITNGESKIVKLVCCFLDGKVGLPCGACREYLMQLDKNSGNIEILTNIDTMKTVRLKDIIPMWWADECFK